jgi:metallo-beta-lactamase class B
MKFFLAAILSVVIYGGGFSQTGYQKINLSPDLELIKLSDQCYIHVSYADMGGYGRVASNGLIYIRDGKALLFDTPVTDSLTAVLTSWITGSMKLRLAGFVPNHWHSDCMGGLGYLKKLGIPSYANQKTIDMAILKGLPVPDHGFTDSLELLPGNKRVDCFYLGAGHSADNIVVWIPSEKVLFGGCMVKDLSAKGLGNLSDADLHEWPLTIQRVMRKFPSARIVIPGHGNCGGPELLQHTADLLKTVPGAAPRPDPSARKIDSLYDVDINGCRQKILVQSNDIRKPVLLYLHGGPGSSALIYSHLYSDRLKDNFVFVNWDQRGTAFSYREGMDTTKISEDQIRADALTLVNYLIATFHTDKIYLIGHSFGSVIGLQLVADHPELFKAYIGVGQVIDWNKSLAITYNWLHDTLSKAHDVAGLNRIEGDQYPYIDLIIKYGGHHRLSLNLDSLRTTSPYYFDGYFELAEEGRLFSQYYMGKNVSTGAGAGRSIYDIPVPLYFFVGKNDHVIACAPQLVADYCHTARAPKKEMIWFYHSAHYMNVEEPDKFQDELIRILHENQ